MPNFIGCEFESLEAHRVPEPIAAMIHRAMRTIGDDQHVLTSRWTTEEAKHFSYDRGYDICCADTVAWILQGTGVVDHSKDKSIWVGPGIGLKYSDTFHGAYYWAPWDKNRDHLKLVACYSNLPNAKGFMHASAVRPGHELIDAIDAQEKDPASGERTFLPGDYFLYSPYFMESKAELGPWPVQHVNIYVGNYRVKSGTPPKGYNPAQIYCIVNGSIGSDEIDGSAYVNPLPIGSLRHWLEGDYIIWHCRVRAVERLYDQAPYASPLGASGAPFNPWALYANNESLDSGAGGLFGLGMSRNIHGGIHLFSKPPESGGAPKKKDEKKEKKEWTAADAFQASASWTPVRAMAPGYIVAARLPPLNTPSMTKEALDGFRSWPGFVLIRHDVVPQPTPAAPLPLYSLYMHLGTPPSLLCRTAKDLADPNLPLDDRYFKEVPWYRKVIQHRFGAWVRVGNAKPAKPSAASTTPQATTPAPPPVNIGDVFWLSEKRDPSIRKKEYKVYPGSSSNDAGAVGAPSPDSSLSPVTPNPEDVDADGRPVWLFKPPAAPLQRALEGLLDGKVVTFAEPFLTVKSGDVIGFAGELSAGTYVADSMAINTSRARPAAAGNGGGGGSGAAPPAPVWERVEIPYGFLHWEVFAPTAAGAGERNAVQLIIDEVAKVELNTKPVVTFGAADLKDEADNYVDDLSAFKKLLGPSLVDEKEKESFEKAFEGMEEHSITSKAYYRHYTEHFDDPAKFAPASIDAKPVDYQPPAQFRYTYPFQILIDASLLPAPESNSLAKKRQYTFDLDFQRIEGATPTTIVTGTVVIDQARFNDTSRRQGNNLVINLRVPAEAEQVRIKPGPGFVLAAGNRPEDSTLVSLKTAADRHWRNLQLQHPSEWSTDSMKKLLEKLRRKLTDERKKLRSDASDEDIKAEVDRIIKPDALAPFAWCGAPEVRIDRDKLSAPASTTTDLAIDAGSGSGSLFGTAVGQIPVTQSVDALHPVTALSALNLLHCAGTVRVADSQRIASFYSDDKPPPFAFGWVLDTPAAQLRLGDMLTAIVVDNDFDYDVEKNKVTVSVQDESAKSGKSQKRLLLARDVPYKTLGILALRVRASFWGTVKLSLEPGGSSPKVAVGAPQVEIPALALGTVTPEERAALLHQPFRSGDSISFLVKVNSRDFARAEAFVTVQTSTDDGLTWKDHDKAYPVVLSGVPGVSGAPPPTASTTSTASTLNESLIKVDPTNPELIVGVVDPPAPPVAPKPGQKQAPRPLAEGGVTYESYVRAYSDIRLACSLVEKLQRLRTEAGVALTPTELDGDGLGGVFRAGPDVARQGKSIQAINSQLSEKARALGIASDPLMPEGSAVSPVSAVGSTGKTPPAIGFTLRLASDELQQAEKCEALRATLAGLRLSDDGKFILGSKGGTRVTENFSLSEFTSVYRRATPLVLHKKLALAVHDLGKKLAEQPSINHLAFDGLSCSIVAKAPAPAPASAKKGVKAPDVAELAEGTGRFLRIEKQKGLLRLTPLLDPEHSVVAKVPAAQLYADLAAESTIEPGKRVALRFSCTVLNGGFATLAHGLPAEEHPQSIAFAEFVEARDQRAFGHFTYGPTPPAPAPFVKCAFGRNVGAKLIATTRDSSVRISVELLGNAELWADWEIEIDRWFAGKSVAKQRLKPPKTFNANSAPTAGVTGGVTVGTSRGGSLGSIEVHFPLGSSPADRGDNTFKINAIRRKGAAPEEPGEKPAEVSGSLNLKPEVKSIEQHVTDTEVVITAKLNGIESFPFVDGHPLMLGKKEQLLAPKAFELVVVDSAEPTKELKVPVSFMLGDPTKTIPPRGYCNEQGELTASIDKAALRPGHAYDIRVRRPAGFGPIRGETIGPSAKVSVSIEPESRETSSPTSPTSPTVLAPPDEALTQEVQEMQKMREAQQIRIAQ